MTSALRENLSIEAPRGSGSLTQRVDELRGDATRTLDPGGRASFGQFLTPLPTAQLMASMITRSGGMVSIVDPGAGIGTLSAAAVEELCSREPSPTLLRVVAYEVDPDLLPFLRGTLQRCRSFCEERGVGFEGEIRTCDFIADTVDRLRGGLFDCPAEPEFDLVIQNPPYRKIATGSQTRSLIESLGVGTVNLYAGFVVAAIRLLKPGGELIAITPRSFCNGPYFKPFREFLRASVAFRRFHLFNARDKAFQDDSVLQETVITHMVRGNQAWDDPVTIALSEGPCGDTLVRHVPLSEVISPKDKERFIHLVADGVGAMAARFAANLRTSLNELGLCVSTGRVVDFRVREHLLKIHVDGSSAPLLYPGNLRAGFTVWPREIRKPQALALSAETSDQALPNGCYVLVKRFSSKEERRRVTAAIHEPSATGTSLVAFENHLNYFHAKGTPLTPTIARGLALYLNSSVVDECFRQFNGHTQVNATDLRNLPYPTREELERIGARVNGVFPEQPEIDRIIKEELMSNDGTTGEDYTAAKKRIEEATRVLTDLGMPRAQVNERSALTLLALLDLAPEADWESASSVLIGITPMMEFMKAKYGKEYAPNTRETVRRQTVHQFVQAALIIENPDDPTRPTNSPKTVYSIEPRALALLRKFGKDNWKELVRRYQSQLRRCMPVPLRSVTQSLQ